jgi:hypothetical protein
MTETKNSESDKKLNFRSASYPAISISNVVGLVTQIKKSFPTSSFKREDIVAVLKKNTVHIDISAAVQYGLVERTGDSYKLSKKVQSVLNWVTEKERDDTLIEAFCSPKLYVELIEKFRGHAIPPDQQLRAILTRFHGITESAAPKAAELFLENAKYVNAIDENRILFGEAIADPPDGDNNSNDGNQNTNSNNQETPIIEKPLIKPEKNKEQLLLEQINNSRDMPIYLSEKKIAHLIYPENLNEKDIQILKLQLEALALTL